MCLSLRPVVWVLRSFRVVFAPGAINISSRRDRKLDSLIRERLDNCSRHSHQILTPIALPACPTCNVRISAAAGNQVRRRRGDKA